jgi:hypothetical protein
MRRLATHARAIATLGALALLLPVAHASAAVHCVNKSGAGGCSPTIQGAVDAAGPGDAIVIAPGIYTESAGILVPNGKDGLRISGPQAAIVDPVYQVGSSAVSLTIDASDVSVTGLTFRNGGSSAIVVKRAGFTLSGSKVTGPSGVGVNFLAGANNGTVRASTIEGCASDSIRFSAIGLKLLSSTIASGGFALVGSGDSLTATGNTFQSVGAGIRATSNSAVVQRNTFTNIYGNADVIRIDGTNANVSSNSMKTVGGFGITVTGGGAIVTANTIGATDIAIDVTGDGAVITRNVVLDSGVVSIQALGDAIAISSNRITPPADGYGIVAYGNTVQITSNTVSGGRVGIAALGDRQTISSNQVQDAVDYGVGLLCETHPFDAATSECTGATVALNRVSRVGGEGVTVEAHQETGAVEIRSNTVTSAAGGCFHVDQSGTSPLGMSLSGNRALGCGSSASTHGFEVLGSGHTLSLNSASGTSGDGYYVRGSNISLTSNTSLFAREDGFEIRSGASITLTRNHAGSFNASGFALGAGVSGVTASGNTVTAPGIVGLCNATGTALPDDENAFGTTAAPPGCDRAHGYF